MNHDGWQDKRAISIVRSFCGYGKLTLLANRARNKQVKAAFEATFLTGGRSSEVLSLKKDQIEVGKEFVKIHDMPVLKSHKVNIDEPNWDRDVPRRTFVFPSDEPLVKDLLEYVDRSSTGRLFPFSYSWFYKAICEMDDGTRWLWPHRLRSERASCLVVNYNYDVLWLMNWFGWNASGEAVRYSKLSTTDHEAKMRNARLNQSL